MTGPNKRTICTTAECHPFSGVRRAPRTGEQSLLLYEDIAHRRRPVQIIRFLRGLDAARPDSTR